MHNIVFFRRIIHNKWQTYDIWASFFLSFVSLLLLPLLLLLQLSHVRMYLCIFAVDASSLFNANNWQQLHLCKTLDTNMNAVCKRNVDCSGSPLSLSFYLFPFMYMISAPIKSYYIAFNLRPIYYVAYYQRAIHIQYTHKLKSESKLSR